MGNRPKHPKKELEEVLSALESQGWFVYKDKKYYKAKCGCGQHMKTIHISPSTSSYKRNLEGQLRRTGCYQ